MQRSTFTLLGACLSLCLSLPLYGQTSSETSLSHLPAVDDDPRVILEVGAALNWTISGGAATFAPSLAIETTPIENWLELEAGITPIYTRNSQEWDADFLFKKPWTLTPKAEFMIGVGPGWAHLTQKGRTSDVFSGEVAGDFMFWPTGRHHFGWFLEPAYEYNFAAGHQKSIALTAGLLIGLARRHQ